MADLANKSTPTFAEVKAYVVAMQKASAQLARWKRSAQAEFEDLEEKVREMEEVWLKGMTEAEFKSEFWIGLERR